MFTPKIGEDEPILTSIFFKGVETTNQVYDFEGILPKDQKIVFFCFGWWDW